MSIKNVNFQRFISQDKGPQLSERINKRKQLLTEIRQILSKHSHDSKVLTEEQFFVLLANNKFIDLYFKLLDTNDDGLFEQEYFFEKLRAWTEYNCMKNSDLHEERLNFIDLLESITYLICQEEDITLTEFSKIITTKGVPKKLCHCLGEKKTECTLVEFMNFILETTKSSTLDTNTLENLHNVFLSHFGRDKKEITFEDFKTIIPSKDAFFQRRLFQLFDCDKSGTISIAEFCETIHEFSKEDSESKIALLFHIYDVNDNGKLYKENFVDVLKACMKESSIKLDETQVNTLANVLFEDGCKPGENYMTLDCFQSQFKRQENLTDNLAMMMNKWILPKQDVSRKPKKKALIPEETKRYFSSEYWQSNSKFLVTIIGIIVLMIIITIERLIYFRNMTMLSGFTPNVLYMFSRAAGKNILALSIIVIILVLRNTITFLRNNGFGKYLPLDNNIYLHKIVGTLIFFLGMLHSFCHFTNFAVNIQPDPVKYLQLTYKYWEYHFGVKQTGEGKVWKHYHVPPGCRVPTNMYDIIENCPEESLNIPDGVNMDYIYNHGNFTCQVCDEDSHKWSYTEWILTMKPGLFGIKGGIANPTGVGLFVIMIIMFFCSLPVVRRRGHFELFFFTHYLYLLYYILLVLHAPEFWKWFLPIGILWVGERIYRVVHMFMGKGRTIIEEGNVLPSNVTNLVIKRPPGFNFNPGDWVFVNIPRISTSEWHPFTISSAPEVRDQFTLHIRGVGHWTNKLHKLFKDIAEEQKNQSTSISGSSLKRSKTFHLRETLKRKYNVLHQTIKENVKESQDDNFQNYINEIRPDTLEERKQARMKKRETKLNLMNEEMNNKKCLASISLVENRPSSLKRHITMRNAQSVKFRKTPSITSLTSVSTKTTDDINSNADTESTDADNKIQLAEPFEIYVDGPFGSPSSNIYRAEHAVLIGTGIGITPFASILQSIMHRYWSSKLSCPKCDHQWTNGSIDSLFNLKKVDFFWINRDHNSFEWFVNLLSQLEIEQYEHEEHVNEGHMSRFLDMHMYVTSVLQKTDMKAVALQMALDMLHEKEQRDLITGLKSRMNAGRPNWNKVFTKLRDEKKGKVTVFYCGNPMLAKTLRQKCQEFGFNFRKEVF